MAVIGLLREVIGGANQIVGRQTLRQIVAGVIEESGQSQIEDLNRARSVDARGSPA